jgi:cysteinyl-tRNA synthetase
MNITDVDDKIIRNAGAEHKDPPSTPRPSWKIAPPSDWSGPSASSPPPTIS